MTIALYEKCAKFQKMADDIENNEELSVSKISVEENNQNPILKELSKIESFDDRVEFADKHYKELGVGSSRTIFQMDDKTMVIKIAHNDKGIVQNLAEMDPNMQRPCTNHVLIADAKGKWIIVRFTDTVSKESFKKLTGFSFDSFMNGLFYKFNNESEKWSPPKHYEEIEQSDFFQCMAGLILDCDLQIGDIDKPSSWGELDGKAVLRDYGLTRKVYKDYYKDDNSSSSSSSSTTKSSI